MITAGIELVGKPPLTVIGAMLFMMLFEDPPRMLMVGKGPNSGRAAMSFLALMPEVRGFGGGSGDGLASVFRGVVLSEGMTEG